MCSDIRTDFANRVLIASGVNLFWEREKALETATNLYQNLVSDPQALSTDQGAFCFCLARECMLQNVSEKMSCYRYFASQIKDSLDNGCWIRTEAIRGAACHLKEVYSLLEKLGISAEENSTFELLGYQDKSDAEEEFKKIGVSAFLENNLPNSHASRVYIDDNRLRL